MKTVHIFCLLQLFQFGLVFSHSIFKDSSYRRDTGPLSVIYNAKYSFSFISIYFVISGCFCLFLPYRSLTLHFYSQIYLPFLLLHLDFWVIEKTLYPDYRIHPHLLFLFVEFLSSHWDFWFICSFSIWYEVWI